MRHRFMLKSLYCCNVTEKSRACYYAVCLQLERVMKEYKWEHIDQFSYKNNKFK